MNTTDSKSSQSQSIQNESKPLSLESFFFVRRNPTAPNYGKCWKLEICASGNVHTEYLLINHGHVTAIPKNVVDEYVFAKDKKSLLPVLADFTNKHFVALATQFLIGTESW